MYQWFWKCLTTKKFSDTYVSFIIPVEGENNKFVVGLGRHIVFVVWDGESDKVDEIKMLSEVDHQSPESMENRLNDAKCDTSGRLWAGEYHIFYLAIFDTILRNNLSIWSQPQHKEHILNNGNK